MTGKYGKIIDKARNAEGQLPDSAEVDTSAIPSHELPQPDVNMTIKVPKAWRQHWVSKAKGEGSTLTAVIIDALTERYGRP